MISEEQFEKIELAHGCGYWNVCDDHTCPCHPTAAVSQGYSEETYASMKHQQEEDMRRYDW